VNERKIAELPESELLGLRERKKLDKSKRIKAAAKTVFREKGYVQATMREVSDLAGVAAGTLFLYARDKRDLLLSIVNDDLDRLTDEQMAQIDPRARLIDQLVQLLRSRYDYWAVDRVLSLHALQEVVLSFPGDPFDRRRRVLTAHMAELVTKQQDTGRVRRDEPADAIADLLQMIYLSAVRAWLRNFDESVDSGLKQLRDFFRLALRGVTVEAGDLDFG
jgi:AcrR family transcriptional regulator